MQMLLLDLSMFDLLVSKLFGSLFHRIAANWGAQLKIENVVFRVLP